MRIGVIVPTLGRAPQEPGLGLIARAAEEAGADGLWVDDHVVEVTDPGSPYPYAAGGTAGWSSDADRYESLTCCAWLLAATGRCRVGTAVLVLPQRNVLELAKVTASLDRLSGGRLALGVGVGWRATEIEALGYSFAGRGRRADEMLDTLRACWQGAPEPVAGDQVRLPAGLRMLPTPVRGSVPLLVGGMSPVALRRAARRGDGWLAVARLGELEPDALTGSLAQLEDLRAAAGRGRAPFELILKLHSEPNEAAELPAALAELTACGFTEVIIEPDWKDLEAAVATVAAARAAATPS